MCPANIEQDAESHLVSSSRPLNLPNGPRLWSCSRTRMSKHETTGDPSNKYCWFLYLHERRCFFVFCCCVFFKFCDRESAPVGYIVETKQGKDAQGHEIWIEALSSWDGATGLCSYSRGLSVSLRGRHAHTYTHTHTHTLTHTSVVSLTGTKRDREVAAVTFCPAVLQQHLSPSTRGRGLKHYQALHGYCYNNYSFFIFNFLQILLFYTLSLSHTHTHTQIEFKCTTSPSPYSYLSKWWENKTNVASALSRETVQSVNEACPQQSKYNPRISINEETKRKKKKTPKHTHRKMTMN